MKAISVIDKDYGILFNRRRVSMDRMIRKNILEYVDGQTLWMSPYSYQQFEKDDPGNIRVDENYLELAGEDDFVFSEGDSLQGYNLDELILYRFDRKYPADTYLDVAWGSKTLCDLQEFQGYSHDLITREIYR